ncbi:MAG: hypothetical protein ABEJ94_06450 [Halorientalis sp.]
MAVSTWLGVRIAVAPSAAATVLAFVLGGAALGVLSGLVPGLHANNMALLLAAGASSVDCVSQLGTQPSRRRRVGPVYWFGLTTPVAKNATTVRIGYGHGVRNVAGRVVGIERGLRCYSALTASCAPRPSLAVRRHGGLSE